MASLWRARRVGRGPLESLEEHLAHGGNGQAAERVGARRGRRGQHRRQQPRQCAHIECHVEHRRVRIRRTRRAERTGQLREERGEPFG